MRARAWPEPRPFTVLPGAWADLFAVPGVRSLTISYLRLAVGSLLVSGVFVLLVAIARTPLVELVVGKGYLHVALVAHVVFALDAWLLAFAAALWVIGAVRAGASLGRPAWLGMGMASFGAVLMVAVPLAGLGEPVMADYVPILMHPVFLLGLVLFFGGIACTAASLLASVRWLAGTTPLEVQALGIGAAAYLAALASMGLAAVRWGTVDHASLVWGAGHLFQVVNASALISLWIAAVHPRDPRWHRLVRACLAGFGVSIAMVLAVPVASVPWEAVAPLFWAGAGTPLIATWFLVVFALLRPGQVVMRRQDRAFLLFSLVLLAVGGLIALPGMGNDTRVTAHYHAVVGAVTTMFMGHGYRLLSRMGIGLAWRWLARAQPYLYGFGLLVLVAGLFLAGEAGTTRKTFEAIARGELTLAGALFVVGALATVAGGIAFVTTTGRALLSEAAFAPAGAAVAAPPPRPPRWSRG